ncbi:MAG: glycosyltransferase family 2 protein [Planctomycetes bacterium]|nr:glycosyltransferase family 2 protein [Planctomycetota bacterium]
MSTRVLTALPVFNEAPHVGEVLDQVVRYSGDVLVVDDGSTDGTSDLLAQRGDVRVVTHRRNQGYGSALMSAFRFADENGYDVVVTIDCDGQHEPQRIGQFIEASTQADIVSGSRYLRRYTGDTEPPAERRHINMQVTAELNRRLGLELTDAFCGFKAYRVDALRRLNLTEPGYAMPLQLWVQARAEGLSIVEQPVPLIYLDESRSFGGVLEDGQTRLEYYHLVIDRAIAATGGLGHEAVCGACAPDAMSGDMAR